MRIGITLSDKEAWRCFLLPGGLLLLTTGVLLGLRVPLSASAINLLFAVACAAVLMLSLRFRSDRALLAASFVFLSQRAISFFASGRTPVGSGRIALEVISVFLPLNFLLLMFLANQGRHFVALARMLVLALFESVFVAIACRAGQAKSPAFIRYTFVDSHLFKHGSAVPQLAILGFIVCMAVLFIRVFRTRTPIDAGLFWSLASAFIALTQGGVGHIASAYFTTAVFVIAGALIESSYVLAYHDELTGLPGRRAFNELRASLVAPFSIAVVDIDHFKRFNDSYGHDTGDQVLRMVARRLGEVGGGGKAFRIGGEEFAIVFRGDRLEQVLPYLEQLRGTVERASFRLRALRERREIPRSQPDRRETPRKKAKESLALRRIPDENYLSVTVSIGAAEANSPRQTVSTVYEAADRALYRAKKAGRNRVETTMKSRIRKPRLKSSIA
ncbi:MAG TPA: GGDEF domain-containing protein [Terriglobales bacterium]|nr:GGDEF domain-containing protein [Terriglobales bacterium]